MGDDIRPHMTLTLRIPRGSYSHFINLYFERITIYK